MKVKLCEQNLPSASYRQRLEHTFPTTVLCRPVTQSRSLASSREIACKRRESIETRRRQSTKQIVWTQGVCRMAHGDGSRSFYFFDIDDNLLFLSTKLYLWNAETQSERAISSGEFAEIQSMLGRPGPWEAWAIRSATFRDFNDQDVPSDQQSFVRDVTCAVQGNAPWQGSSWRLLVHAAEAQRPIAVISARGHSPKTIEAGFQKLVSLGQLSSVPPILGIYTVTNEEVLKAIGVTDAATTIPSRKKIAIKKGVEVALARYGSGPPHRFGMSDDDPANVVLAISAMRDCKLKYLDKRFFVINTNGTEFVKLEIFPVNDPVTAHDHVLSDATKTTAPESRRNEIQGMTASIYVSDMDRAVEFYEEALGLTLQSRIGNEWAQLATADGGLIGLHPAQPSASVTPGTAGAINIELRASGDLDAAVTSLKAHGVRFVTEILNYEHVRLITCGDPDGNKLFLAQPLP
jgi:predicted enzyme related to lactoylglutathione lyase